MNATNGNHTNVTELFAWETVAPLINGYGRIMRFSQRNGEDPDTIVYGNLKLDQMYEGGLNKGKPNGFGRDYRSTSDNDKSNSWTWGFFKNSFNLEGKGRIYHIGFVNGTKSTYSIDTLEQGLYSLDQPSSLMLGPVDAIDFQNDFKYNYDKDHKIIE